MSKTTRVADFLTYSNTARVEISRRRPFSITAEAPESRNEIRGVYGGLPLAISGLLLYRLIRPDLSHGFLFTLAVCSTGFAVGRVVSAIIDRSFHRSPLLWTVLELIVAALIASNIKGL